MDNTGIAKTMWSPLSQIRRTTSSVVSCMLPDLANQQWNTNNKKYIQNLKKFFYRDLSQKYLNYLRLHFVIWSDFFKLSLYVF